LDGRGRGIGDVVLEFLLGRGDGGKGGCGVKKVRR
jgi:hypothetical protein